jgi:hypothetical protein
MRMIERRHGADAHEFLGADLYFGNADIIMEMRNDILGHALNAYCALQKSTISLKPRFPQSTVKKPQMPASYGRFGP